ncbi:hypothetical protein EIN_327430 [Entamoeba invadens IP1]|uniref:Kinase n=1 Tax=Entamoeba invadens IP1 TaxID=370355 RepID=A0A0A1U3A5_ENTIV|nr:hypothetical protein EIN_327430 [Entamoeba invadens IP1]ELP86096.1 hypothetical protein EIN_327430 [Entamoeba invadens IP1]|eukprot:XP_004185442.1 hypothetical protein EIN_327430 [Entamoeba invadens IP1]
MEVLQLKYPTYISTENKVQAGGHDDCIKISGAFIEKIIPVYVREIEFYEENKDVKELKGLIPTYSKHYLVDGKNAIQIENITFNYIHPCVLDIKICGQSWCDDTTAERLPGRQKLDLKTTTRTLNMRFSGMKLFDGHKTLSVDNLIYRVFNDRESLCELIRPFFDNIGEHKETIKSRYIDQIVKIAEGIKTMKYSFYSSSLLFVYDWNTEKADCRWIDFSHYYNNTKNVTKYDDGVQKGMSNMIDIIKSL